MADQSQVIKGAVYDVFCVFHTADTGALITNPAGLAARVVNEANPTGAAATNTPTRVDATGGVVHLQLTTTEMNSDYVFVRISSTTEKSDPQTFLLHPAAAAAPTDATISDAVWDEAIAGHVATGSTGELLQDIDDEVDTLHAATAGAGAIAWSYTLTEADLTPIADADVWVTSDEAGTNVLGSGTTNQYGIVSFHLDAGTIYVWTQKTGWNFTNPDTEVVS